MKGLILVLLAVAVGDAHYDPRLYVNAAPINAKETRGACFVYSGYWRVDEVGVEADGGTYAASSRHTEDFIHAIISTFDIDWNAYWNNESGPIPQEMHECAEFDNNLDWLNICVDFRKRPDLLPNACYDNATK